MDLASIQQKIISFTPIEILARDIVAQRASKVYDIVSLPNRGILLNLTRGERNERDWAQFHDPKNLAEALSIEAGELSCPVRSAINIHSANEFMAATGPFWTSNGVKKTSSGRLPSSPAISPKKNSRT